MRLINTKTLELSEFFDSEIPKYAILSHTWGKEEVSYQEWREKKSKKKAGYSKIRNFCEICRQDGFEWAWADTCCIDKTSSAELSEAINSMYQWYLYKTCYAYLVDVSFVDNFNINDKGSAFHQSRWFTRGWTLQELIAPNRLLFFTANWTKIGDRNANALTVADITGIPELVLQKSSSLRFFSVAQKMSWAARRNTTRTEDVAYCLLGLFNINMPLLYGEGRKAFFRLQEEMMKISSDHTIFAWAWGENTADYSSGLLAQDPYAFAGSSRFRTKEHALKTAKKTYSMTNRGLKIELPLMPPDPKISNVVQLAILNCCSDDDPSKYIAIYLASLEEASKVYFIESLHKESYYERVNCNKLEFVSVKDFSVQKIYVRRGGLDYSLCG